MEAIVYTMFMTPCWGNFPTCNTELKKKRNCAETANIEMTKMTRNSMISVKISKENSWLLTDVSTFFLLFHLFSQKKPFWSSKWEDISPLKDSLNGYFLPMPQVCCLLIDLIMVFEGNG